MTSAQNRSVSRTGTGFIPGLITRPDNIVADADFSSFVPDRASAAAQEPAILGARAQRYLIDLIRIDTTNPPGNETRVAEYLKRVTSTNGISAELLGDNPARLNFVARLPPRCTPNPTSAAADGPQRRGSRRPFAMDHRILSQPAP